MANVIAFKDRGSTDFLNKKILEMLRESPEYDVELVAANSKIVRAHRVVLSMYSQYFRKCLAQSAPDTKLIGNFTWNPNRNKVFWWNCFPIKLLWISAMNSNIYSFLDNFF